MLLGWAVGANGIQQAVYAALRAGMSLKPAQALNANTEIGMMAGEAVQVQQRFRPDNDGSSGAFTHNWSTGSDVKIPWPVKAAGVITYFKTLAAVAVGQAVFVRKISMTKAAVAVGVPFMDPVATFRRSMAATAVGVPTLTKAPLYSQALSAVAVGVATLTKAATYRRTLAATAVGVAAVARKISMTLAATAVGVASVSRVTTFRRTLAATAVGAAGLSRKYFKTLGATAVGTPTLTPTFISGGGGGGGARSKFKRFVKLIKRR